VKVLSPPLSALLEMRLPLVLVLAGGRAHSAAAAGADAEFENAWHQRTAQIRGMVENNS
jgi:hypothetical protein